MSSLRGRLLSAEEDYLSALISGEDAMIAFGTRWEAILADVDAALESGLDSGTITLAHTTSLRIATLADTSAELFDSYNSLTSQLMAQLDHCMSALTLDDSCETLLSDCDLSALQSGRGRLPSLPSSEHGARNPRKRHSSSPDEIVKRPRLNVDFIAHPTRKLRRVRSRLPSVVPVTTPRPDSSAVSTSPVTRKRRLSDATSPSLVGAKRLCAGPRLHAVSDTYAILHSSKCVTTIPTSPVQVVVDGPCPHPIVPIRIPTLDPVTLDVHSLPYAASPGGSDAGELFATAPLNVLPPGDSDLDVFLDSFLSFGTSTTHLSSMPHSPSVQVLESLLSSELYSNPSDQVVSPCDTSTTASSPSTPLTPALSSPSPYVPPKYEFADHDFYDGVDISSAVSDTGDVSPLAITPQTGRDWCRTFEPNSSDGVHIVHTDGAAANPFDLLWHASPLACWASNFCDTSEVPVFGEVPFVQASGKLDLRRVEPGSDHEPTIFLEGVLTLRDTSWDSDSASRPLPFTVDVLSVA